MQTDILRLVVGVFCIYGGAATREDSIQRDSHQRDPKLLEHYLTDTVDEENEFDSTSNHRIGHWTVSSQLNRYRLS